MKKIALINPPSPFLKSDIVMPPLGIMYLSAFIKNNTNLDEIDIEIIDLATAEKKIPDGFTIYAFTSTTPQYSIALELMKELKALNPNSIFVIGGAHATCFSKKCIDDGFDYVITHEGESSLLKLIKSIELPQEKILYSENIADINEIPFPDRDFDGFKKYQYKLDDKNCTTMITSRGCPFQCGFCCKTWTNPVRLRSASNVITEIEEIRTKYNINSIMFYDDTFTLSHQRLLQICDHLKRSDTTWRCFIQANTITKEILEKMYDSGCAEIGMGVESGNQSILNTINKTITVERAIQICKWCQEIGLRIKTFLIIGLPGETFESINDTITFINKAHPSDFDITIYTPFPNTDIWNNTSDYDIKFDKENMDYSKMFYKGIEHSYSSQVSTSSLSISDIERLRDHIDINIRKSVYGVSNR